MSYATSSKERPKEIDGGGRGTYCCGCVPECKSASHDRDKNRTSIGFFKFPNDPDLQRTYGQLLSKEFVKKRHNNSFLRVSF